MANPTKYSKVTYAQKKLNKDGSHSCYVPTERGKIIYYYWIKFSNGDSGKYSSFDDNQKTFVAGKYAFYKTEIKQGKFYEETLIRPATPVKSLLPENIQKIKETKLIKKSMANDKEIIASCKSMNVKNAVEGYIKLNKTPAGLVNITNMAEIFTQWCLSDAVKDEKKGTVAYDAAKIRRRMLSLEQAILCANNFPSLPVDEERTGITSSDDLLVVAEFMFSYSESDLMK